MTSVGSHDNLRFGATGPVPRGGVLTAWGRRDSQLGLGGDAAWQAQWTGLQVGQACKWLTDKLQVLL